MGDLDTLSREFAREHSGRLWKQLVLAGGDEGEAPDSRWPEVLALTVAAAVTVQVARLLSGFPSDASAWLVRNASLFVLPFLASYFARRRGLSPRQSLLTIAPFAIAAIVVNLYPYREGASTELLVAAHLPVVLWFVVAYPYMSGVVRSHERRMDFVRFTGEWFIYYVLIALGGGVLTGLTVGILVGTGVDPERLVEWLLPSGAAGAVIVAAWLVESKQRVVENMAPVLTMVFTPLFAVMLTVSAVVYAVTGLGGAFDRELLGIFDALMLARIGDLGFTPNRTAALGLNLVLLVNLAGAAWLSMRFLTGRSTFNRLERWQTTYMPVFALWSATVVVVLPPLFAFT